MTGDFISEYEESCGRMDEKIAKYFPEYARYLKWQLCGTNQPLHYIANTVYWAEQGELEKARKSAIWSDASLSDLLDKEKLRNRLPNLLAEFQKDMESLGFTYG